MLVELSDEETSFILEFEHLLRDFMTALDDILELFPLHLHILVVHQGILRHRILKSLVLLTKGQVFSLKRCSLALYLVFKSFSIE